MTEKEILVNEAKIRDDERKRIVEELLKNQYIVADNIVRDLIKSRDIPACIGAMPERPTIRQAQRFSGAFEELSYGSKNKEQALADDELVKFKEEQFRYQNQFERALTEMLSCLTCKYFDRCSVLSGKYNTYVGE